MGQATAAGLADPQVQGTLLAEAIASADVGFLVWDEDRHYVAANKRACDLLACTLEQLLDSAVGERTVEGEETIEAVVRREGGRGRVTVKRFDGRTITLEYVTFAVRTAAMPFMASVVWPADE